MSKIAKMKKELHMKEMAMKNLIKKGWVLRQEIIQLKHTIEVLQASPMMPIRSDNNESNL